MKAVYTWCDLFLSKWTLNMNTLCSNCSPATWLPGYLHVPCPHCEQHPQWEWDLIVTVSFWPCVICKWRCRMQRYYGGCVLALMMTSLPSRGPKCPSLCVCALLWLTLTSLDCSLDVLLAQHPCKSHGPLWQPEGEKTHIHTRKAKEIKREREYEGNRFMK